MTSPSGSSSARRHRRFSVGLGFAALLGMMLFIAITGIAHMDAAQHQLDTIVSDHMRKIDLATHMRLAARERTVSLQKMVLFTDPFERDEYWLLFNQQAGEFAKARDELLAIVTTDVERDILQRQGALTAIAVPLQNEVADLISAGKTIAAQRLLTEKAIPAQDQVLKELFVLYQLQEQMAAQAAEKAKQSYRKDRELMLALSLMALALGVGIAFIVLYRARRASAELHQEKERALATVYSIGDGVVSTDSAGRIEFLNPVAEQLSGWTSAEAVGRGISEVLPLLHDISRVPVQNPVTHALTGGTAFTSADDIVLTDRTGGEHAIEYTATPIRNPLGGILGAVLVFRDVTEIRALAREIAHQASHDTLTGLFNRREFEKRLQQALDRTNTHGVQHALCYIDLDLFRTVNDSSGHAAGDEMLRQIGQLLLAQLPRGATLARPAGDKFMLLLEDCTLERAGELAGEMRKSLLAFRFVWEDRTFDISASFGVVRVAAETGSVYDAMQAADVACRVAKDEGRNRVHLYQQNDLTILRRQREIGWVQRLNRAMQENRFMLYAQTVVPLARRKKRPGHHEILLRLTDESGQVVTPTSYLPAAERYHLMPMFDRWVIHETLRQLSALDWQAPPETAYFDINLSGQSLYDPAFLKFIQDEIRASNIPPNRLCFEITETAAVSNLASAMRLIGELRNLGCRFALDDFGSGLSSFAYLKNMRVDFLKIDGAFVRNLPDDTSDTAMVNSINQVAHAMGIETIAEYVESDAIRDVLTKLGVDYGQGYALAVPRPLPQVLKDLQDLRSYQRSKR